MPVATEIRCLFRDDHEVADAGADHRLAPWAGIRFARLIGLDRVDDLLIDRNHPKNPHSTTATVTRTNTATTVMSAAEFRCLRNGLKPMSPVSRVRVGDASISTLGSRV